MVEAEEKIHYIALGLIPGIGISTAKQLISYCGSAKAIFKQKKHQLLKVPGIGPALINCLFNFSKEVVFARAEKEYEFGIRNNINFLTINDAAYPQRLLQCKDAPYLLYMDGQIDLNQSKVISIVGTRKASAYGKSVTEGILEALQSFNIIVVSGLAYGIDGIAHKKALELEIPTVAVLAHGLDYIYPPAHRGLAQKIVKKNGALITEFMSETIPDKQNFPSRNRIVAGMCDATIVIESAEKGGALITADIAQSYNRDVFAVPGRISDTYSIGCNNLIKNNVAALINCGQDIIDLLGWDIEKSRKGKSALQRTLFVDLDEHEQKVYDHLMKVDVPIHIDQIKREVELPDSLITMSLLSLEIKGIIHSRPGSSYLIS